MADARNMHLIVPLDRWSDTPKVGIGTLQVEYSPDEALNMAAWLLAVSGKTLTEFNQMYAAVLKPVDASTSGER